MTLRDRIIRSMELLRLKGYQMADELRMSPEWFSRIVNGKVEPQPDVALRLDELLRRRGFDPKTLVAGTTSAATDGPARPTSNAAAAIERDLRRELEQAIKAADGRAERLGWLLEQARACLVPPAHWQAGEVNQRARQIADRLNAEADARAPRPPQSHTQKSA